MRHKKAVAIRHVAFENLGTFHEVLADAGFQVSYKEAGLDDLTGLAHEDTTVLFVLGGPIGVNDVGRYPFLTDEIELIASRIAAGRPIIGVCLGAQLMARALGARVYAAERKELGFGKIDFTEAGTRSSLGKIGDPTVLHWHGDTFDMPPGAVRLATTTACENQAFSFGSNAVGLQFHLETCDRDFEKWLIGHSVELDAGGYDILALRQQNLVFGPKLRHGAEIFLRDWLSHIGLSLTPADHCYGT